MSEKGERQEERINVENPLHYVQSRGFSCTPSHETRITSWYTVFIAKLASPPSKPPLYIFN